jgi:ankyrin repeat protein
LLLACPGLDANAKENSNGNAVIFLAAHGGHAEVVSLLLDCPRVDENVKERGNGNTALFISAYEGHTSTIALLLNCPRVDANARSSEGQTGASPCSFFFGS